LAEKNIATMLAGDRLPIQDLMYTAGRGYSNREMYAHTLALHTYGKKPRSIFSTLSIRTQGQCCKTRSLCHDFSIWNIVVASINCTIWCI